MPLSVKNVIEISDCTGHFSNWYFFFLKLYTSFWTLYEIWIQIAIDLITAIPYKLQCASFTRLMAVVDLQYLQNGIKTGIGEPNGQFHFFFFIFCYINVNIYILSICCKQMNKQYNVLLSTFILTFHWLWWEKQSISFLLAFILENYHLAVQLCHGRIFHCNISIITY